MRGPGPGVKLREAVDRKLGCWHSVEGSSRPVGARFFKL